MFLGKRKYKLRELILTGAIMAFGVFVFKFLPMKIFGENILFDASMHIITACFILYAFYLFIKSASLKIFYLLFALLVLMIISIQRILVHAHNLAGILTALVISILAVSIPRWKEVKNI